MERLTQRLRTGEVLMASNYEEKYTEQGWIDVLQNRLAAYEDTWLTPEEIEARIANQMPEAQKETLADHVIDNSGELPGLYAQIDALLAALDIEG